jgi:hypothetical protein
MKPVLVLLALISLVALVISWPGTLPVRALSKPEPQPVIVGSCVNHYNSLLKSAKAALIAGNRAATVEILEEARRIVPNCPDIRDGGLQQASLLII